MIHSDVCHSALIPIEHRIHPCDMTHLNTMDYEHPSEGIHGTPIY